MVEKDLSFITDAMIEASGALRVAATEQNLVINIINKLDVAISKARTLERSQLMTLTEALEYCRDTAPEGHALATVEQPPPIPQQDLGKADQSPKFFVMPAGTVVTCSNEGAFGLSVEQLDASDTPTRIVRLGA